VLEAGPAISQRWRSHYDRLRLHGERRLTGLPGRPIPKEYGRWVRRDDYAAFLEQYFTDSGAEIELNRRIDRIDPHHGGWAITVGTDTYLAEQVVVATGFNRKQKVPDWPGLVGFTGVFMHSGEYKNPAPYVGKHVLVVGVGNSGAEIAVDLVERAVEHVSVSVRNPPVIVPRAFGRFFSLQHLLFVLAHFPTSVLDRTILLLHRLFAGNLSAYGLPKPTEGLSARAARRGGAPILDVGFMRELKAGHFEIVPGVDGFDGAEVICGDRRLTPDVVIAATGYHQDLEPLVGHLGVLDEKGLPQVHAPNAVLPGLYFLGFELIPQGLLWNMSRQAPRLAEAAFLNNSKNSAAA
jgi:cation diffusion facilitator CzcD-associated flavoprotein CzcO